MKLFKRIKRQPSLKASKRLLQLVSGVGVCLLVATAWSSWFDPAAAQFEIYDVQSVPGNVIWGELFKPDSEPILTVKSGDRIRMETVSHEGILADQGDTVEFLTGGGVKANDILPDQLTIKGAVPKSGPGPHVITGPIYVEDAEPGDVLEIRTLDIAYRVPYGVISNRHGRGSLPGEYPENDAPIYTKIIPIDAEREIGIFRPSNGLPNLEIPLKPFMGLMGVVPAAVEDAANSVPPGLYGGNVDIKHLGRGSSLYLPVQVPGALFYSGDPHCAQGNGEVALTAIECSLLPTFELVLHKNMELPAPMGETADAWIAVGLDTDLDEAMKKSVREYLRIVNEKYGLTKADALLYASADIDFEVSQVVDIVKGIHGVIPKDRFTALEK
ncbi:MULTISPECIES: acetamidase/formamidase family protein [Cyanophyceae]|uniref:acetamidase/formamidase family protein n=1 Tax=Cyanophyceae TaxID=3028117 RepID=UPI001689D2BC|nr:MULTISPECIES: acetamidase/formamidase family protein [Cyanophyceae]MBD1914828.1 acetamidase/formamidase family protein [Phormidium sp. FACHB-77]MBD2029946.1 acetamidase/formamidase family protein [Phormidium sp. FACHB-322]MBD2049256.1 acetamidase/formamidase family protein [Leptolyngbya sp. FACHB-60]